MNNFDKIIAQKLSEAQGYVPNPDMWKSIEQSLDNNPATMQSGKGGFIAGIAASVVLGVLFTQLPNLGDASVEHLTPIDTQVVTPTESSTDVSKGFTPQIPHEIKLVASTETEKEEILDKNLSPSSAKHIDLKGKDETIVTAQSDKTKEVKTALQSEHIEIAITPEFKAKGIQCQGEAIRLEALGTYDAVEWLIDGVELKSGKQIDHIFARSGSHQITMIATVDGTRHSSTREVEVFDQPEASIAYKVSASETCFESEVTLSGDPINQSYEWTIQEQKLTGTSVRIPLAKGEYNARVNVINEHGCVSNEQVSVVVEDGRELFIAKAFTPDNNGTNDTWFPTGIQPQDQVQLRAYDLNKRSLVYETVERTPWNGQINGSAERAQRGQKFIYELVVTDECGFTSKHEGLITVL